MLKYRAQHGFDGGRIAPLNNEMAHNNFKWPRDWPDSHSREARGAYTELQLIVSSANSLEKFVYITAKTK